jgi:hypothetical protein
MRVPGTRAEGNVSMTIREQIGDMVDRLDASGHGNLVTDCVPCWILLNKYSDIRAMVFYLSDDTGEVWVIVHTDEDGPYHLNRKDAEDLITGQQQNSFNFGRFRQSRARALQ